MSRLSDAFEAFRNGLPSVQNIDQKKPQGSSVKKKIQPTQLTRQREDIASWRRSVHLAESVHRPDRTDLIKVFNDVILDAHLSALMNTRKLEVLATPWEIVNKDGDRDEEATRLLNADWFTRFIDLSLDSRFWGFTLIEFGDIQDDVFTDIQAVKREYVIPEEKKVRETLRGSGVFSWEDEPYKSWTLFVGNSHDLGLLNQATPLTLWKKLVLGAWAEYNELFGVPYRMAKTDINDANLFNEVSDTLNEMGMSGWGVFPHDVELDFMNAVKAGGHGTFKDMIETANAELAKLILGQTMTSDDGSSRSQAEVHQNILRTYTGADLRFMEQVINSQLIPFLNKEHGFQLESKRFSWKFIEKLSLEQQANIDARFLPFFELDPQYIIDTYGTKLLGTKTNPVEEVSNVASELRDLYDFKNSDGCDHG